MDTTAWPADLSQADADQVCTLLFGEANDVTADVFGRPDVATRWDGMAGRGDRTSVSCRLEETNNARIMSLWLASHEDYSRGLVGEAGGWFVGADVGRLTPEQQGRIEALLRDAAGRMTK